MWPDCIEYTVFCSICILTTLIHLCWKMVLYIHEKESATCSLALQTSARHLYHAHFSGSKMWQMGSRVLCYAAVSIQKFSPQRGCGFCLGWKCRLAIVKSIGSGGTWSSSLQEAQRQTFKELWLFQIAWHLKTTRAPMLLLALTVWETNETWGAGGWVLVFHDWIKWREWYEVTE